MPSRTRAAAVHAVVGALLASVAATESVSQVVFTGNLPGFPTIPGTDGVPVVILGPSLGLMLLAVVTSDLGRDLKITSRVVNGRTVYFVTGPGLRGITLVFGSDLGAVLVIGDPNLLPPTLLSPGATPTSTISTGLPASLLTTLQTLARPSVSVVRPQSIERHAARVEPAAPGGAPASVPSDGAPAAPGAPAPLAPSPPAPPASPSSTSVGGSQDGGRAPVSAVLTARNPLESLMFAGLVRLRPWTTTDHAELLLASPG